MRCTLMLVWASETYMYHTDEYSVFPAGGLPGYEYILPAVVEVGYSTEEPARSHFYDLSV